jgi:hypothetical protein
MRTLRPSIPFLPPLAAATAALWVLGVLWLAGCSSTSSDEGGGEQRSLRVAYVSYNSGQRLELVSEGHTSRLEQYSEVRADASTKVQTTEVMGGLIEVLEKNGFGKYAQAGHLPTDGAGRIAWALEVEAPGDARHVLAHPGLPPAEVKDLQRYLAAFLDVYNATYGLQRVESEPGQEVFKNPAGR